MLGWFCCGKTLPCSHFAQLGPPRFGTSWDPSTMEGLHPSGPQVSAEPCSAGGSSSVYWARKKCPSEREWSSPTMFTHHSVPGSPPLSCTPIFVGTGGASHFSERPCKVKNKTAKTPPLPGYSAQALYKHSSVSHYCSRVVTKWLGAVAVTPRRRDLLPTTTARGLPAGQVGEGAAAGLGLAAAPQKVGGQPLGK